MGSGEKSELRGRKTLLGFLFRVLLSASNFIPLSWGKHRTKIYTERLRSEVQTPFWQKRYLFRIPSIDKWYPFHIPSLWAASLLTASNALCLFWNKNKSLNQEVFPDFFTSIKCADRFFYRPKWQISRPFHILKIVKSLPFYIPEAWERYPFQAGPPHIIIGHYRVYPGCQSPLSLRLEQAMALEIIAQDYRHYRRSALFWLWHLKTPT